MKPPNWGRRLLYVPLTWAFMVIAAPAAGHGKPTEAAGPGDNPVLKSFALLEEQPGYRMSMAVEPSDPKVASYMKQGMGAAPIETLVKDGMRQVSFHFRMPAMDAPGTIDDWEARSVVTSDKMAHLLTSPAVTRIMRLDDQMLAMQLAMLEKQASVATTTALAQGPMGAVTAGLAAAQMASAPAMAARALKRGKDLFSWTCEDRKDTGPGAELGASQLTDMKALGDETLGGVAVSGYELFVRDGDKLRGPMHVFVAKETGLPLRIDIKDPESQGTIHVDYSYGAVGNIEVPDCLKARP